ncbi:MAG TPA: LamG-like jellyroll fold domain-containing protein, partial [Vicinamibacterales bacterium]|nr:LamG-like jellyroll fold domain-containing protein [Vicinamibacterales bacterium]
MAFDPTGTDLTGTCEALSQDLCNDALSHLGISQEIAALSTEDSVEAIQCRRFFPKAVNETLRAFAWPFATKYVTLAHHDGEEETPVNGDWTYAFRVPLDCLMVRRLVRPDLQRGPDPDPPPFRIGQGEMAGLPYESVARALGPTNYWRLQETSGTVADDIGSGADDGTIAGTPEMGVVTPVGTGFRFDGVDDVITMAAVLSTATWSFACWLKPDPSGGAGVYQILLAEIGTFFGVFFRRDAMAIVTLSVAGEARSTTILAAHTWHHIAVTVAANVVTFYVNGVAAGTGTMNSTLTPDRISAATAADGAYKGDLAEVLYEAGATWTSAEIQ